MPEIKYADNPNEETAFVTQDDGTRSRAVLTAAVEGDIEFPDNPNSTKVMVTIDGVKRRAVAVANVAGGGGGDQHNLGYYATQAALEEAHSTAEAGDWAIVGSTDTVWIWDSDNSAWVDSDQKGQVTSVNGQTGDVVIPAGATYTAGTGISIDSNNEISVADPVLVNKRPTYGIWANGQDTGTNVIIGPGTNSSSVASFYNNRVIIGANATSGDNPNNVVIGANARGRENTVTVGSGAVVNGYYSIGVGLGATVTAQKAIAVGYRAGATATGAIQLGSVSAGTETTNSDADTFKVANANGNFEIMSADGTIPADRLTHAINKYSTMPTAASTNEGWIVQFTGTTDATYTHGYIYECKAQGTDPETYAWEAVEVQAGGGGGSSYSAGIGIDITNDVISTDVPMAIAPVNTDAPIAEIKAYPGTELHEGDGVIAIGPGAQAKTTSSGQYATFTGTVVIGEKVLATSNAIHAVAVGNLATVQTAASVAIGYNSLAKGNGGVAIGGGAQVNGTNGGVAIGGNAHAARGAIILSAGNNGVYEAAQGCFDVVLNDTTFATPGQYTLLKYGGLMPADRLASTTGLADGNYRLRCVMASGVPTLEWVAE